MTFDQWWHENENGFRRGREEWREWRGMRHWMRHRSKRFVPLTRLGVQFSMCALRTLRP